MFSRDPAGFSRIVSPLAAAGCFLRGLVGLRVGMEGLGGEGGGAGGRGTGVRRLCCCLCR